MQLVHVFAVGRNVHVTSTKFRVGEREKPRSGSWSVSVANCSMCDKDKSPLLPPKMVQKYKNIFLKFQTSQNLSNIQQ